MLMSKKTPFMVIFLSFVCAFTFLAFAAQKPFDFNAADLFTWSFTTSELESAQESSNLVFLTKDTVGNMGMYLRTKSVSWDDPRNPLSFPCWSLNPQVSVLNLEWEKVVIHSYSYNQGRNAYTFLRSDFKYGENTAVQLISFTESDKACSLLLRVGYPPEA